MSTFGHDEVFTPLRQLAEALERISGLRSAGKLPEALEAVRAAAEGLFGPVGHALDQVDAQSAARLLISRERVDAAAALLVVQGQIHGVRDENSRARACFRRAIELLLEGVLLGDPTPAPTLKMIAELRSKCDEWRLSRRYQEVLIALADSLRVLGA